MDSRNITKIVEKSVAFSKTVDFDIKDTDDIETIYNKIVSRDDIMKIPAYYHTYTTSIAVLWQMICMTMLVGKEKGKLIFIIDLPL